jgi:hypothetical protein
MTARYTAPEAPNHRGTGLFISFPAIIVALVPCLKPHGTTDWRRFSLSPCSRALESASSSA